MRDIRPFSCVKLVGTYFIGRISKGLFVFLRSLTNQYWH